MPTPGPVPTPALRGLGPLAPQPGPRQALHISPVVTGAPCQQQSSLLPYLVLAMVMTASGGPHPIPDGQVSEGVPREVKDGPEARTGPCSSRRLCLGSEGPTLPDGGALSTQSQRTCRDEVAWLGGGKRVDRPGGTGQEPVQQVGPLTAERLLRAPLGTDCACLLRPHA